MITINETNFPDKNFRDWLLKQDYGKDGVLTEKAINSTTLIDVDYQDISSLKGIEHFTALTKLECNDNQLTTLDVSKNTALVELLCGGNQLTALDVSNNTALEELQCYDNRLTTLDVSKNTALGLLWCSDNLLTALDVSNNTGLCILEFWGNQITTIDLSNNTALEILDCSDNQLTSIDLSNNTDIYNISCYLNQIKGAAMDKLIDDLPQARHAMLNLYVNMNSAEGNVCTKAQVAAARAKGWIAFCSDDNDVLIPYAGSDGI